MLVLTVLLLAGMLFGVAAVSVGNGSPLSEGSIDRREPLLPADPVAAADVAALRFTMALRGYRMDEVDAVLDRLSTEISVRDAEIGRLRSGVGLGVSGPLGQAALALASFGVPPGQDPLGPTPTAPDPSVLDGSSPANQYAVGPYVAGPYLNTPQAPMPPTPYDAGAYDAPPPYETHQEPGPVGHGE